MSDIEKQARAAHDGDRVTDKDIALWEAAAEIERLRASNAELVAALKEYVRDFGDNEDGDSQLMADKAQAAIAKAEGKS
jgi:hypothetical protein